MALTRPRYSNIVDGDYKASCRVVTTTNIVLNAAPTNYDGVTFSADDRILVAGQDNAAENGIYSVTTVGTGSNGVWDRAYDANANGRLTGGCQTSVTEGSSAGAAWRLITADPIVIGVTELNWLSTIGASAAGANKQLQFNEAGLVAGTAEISYDNASGNLVLNSTATSVNNTSGALVVKGGVGVAGNVYTDAIRTATGIYWSGNGNPITTGITYTAAGSPPDGPISGDQWYNTDSNILYEYLNDGTSSYWVDIQSSIISSNAAPSSSSGVVLGGTGIGEIQINNNGSLDASTVLIDTTNGNLTVATTTSSTDNNTGALVVKGGVGITGNLNLYNPAANGYFANIAAWGRPSSGVQSWKFYVNPNLNGFSSWILFPDSTAQYTAYTGNADTATKLQTARTINGTSFDGSTNINLASLINGSYGISLNASGTTILDVGGLEFDDSTTQTTAYPGTATTLSLTGNISAGNLTVTSTGNISAGNINVSKTTITYQPASTNGTAMVISAADTKGGAGYNDFLQVTNTSAGATNINKWFRVNTTGELQIINSAYTSQLLVLSDAGDVSIAGNITANGIKPFYSSARPAFRVYGATTTSWNTAVNTGGYMNSNQWTVDYNQGSYLNNSTGVFTAPVDGLYQVNLNARNAGNTSVISQAIIVKNASGGNGGGGTISLMLEFAPSSTMNHAGVGTTMQLAVNDTLVLKVSAGTIQFDSNDSWSVAYIG